ncbi:MAG: phosphoribosylglycinamide formyltransferase [Actinomycetota bacterium]
MDEPKIAVLASGNGTNLQAVLDDPVVGAWVVLVVSDRPDARALRRAADRGVEAVHVDPEAHPGIDAYAAALVEVLREREIGFVALAGFMRVLGPEAVEAYAGRILNVHPSLLPAFPGADSVADALAWGVKITGVTVHLVDEQVDHGPIVAQEAIVVRGDDVWSTLEERVHEVEHRLLPAALRALVEGRIDVDDRLVRVAEPSTGAGT